MISTNPNNGDFKNQNFRTKNILFRFDQKCEENGDCLVTNVGHYLNHMESDVIWNVELEKVKNV